MTDIERLEQFWRRLVLSFSFGTDLNGAVAICYPKVPAPILTNHAASINVGEDEAENLLNRVTDYLLSRGSPFVSVRITPSTLPESFASLLQDHDFERKHERLVMVFEEKNIEEESSPNIKVREMLTSEMDLWTKLLVTNFEMPTEWKEGWNGFFLEWIRKGAKCYLAHIGQKPVGTCCLFSSLKVGGIFAVGTLKQYRDSGIGTALTTHAVVDSLNEGNNLHMLQTSIGGNAERLYAKMGFEFAYMASYFVKKFFARSDC